MLEKGVKLLSLTKTDQADCMGCILRIPLTAGWIGGIFCIFTHCPHSNSPAVLFRSSFLLRFVATLCLSPLVPYFGLTIMGIAWADGTDGKFLLAVADALLLIPAMITGFGALMMTETKCDEFNGLAAIVKCRRYYGVGCFVKDYQVKLIVMALRSSLMGFFSAVSYLSYQLYNFEDHHKFDSPLIRTYSLTLSLFVLGVITMQFVLANIVYEIMFRRCFEVIREALTNDEEPFKLPPLVRLQRLQRLYEALLWNYRVYNKLCDPIFTLNWICLVCIVIISLMVDLILRKEGLTEAPVFVAYVIGIAGILVYIFSCERINNLTRDIVPFLLKYSCSKLKPPEATQVEALITTMTIRKPHLSASHMFVVRAKLLTTITATILTYLLVALQFHVKQ